MASTLEELPITAPLFTMGQFTGGNPWLLLALAPVVVAPVWWWWRKKPLWPDVLWLFLPFCPWVALSYWTDFHWHKDGAPLGSATINSWAALLALGTTIVLVIAGLKLGKHGRILIAYAGLINLWAAAVGALLCVMATSGDWI